MALNVIVRSMFHDSIFEYASSESATGERRDHDRMPSCEELVIDWHAMPGMPGRYGLINESTGGGLVRSSVPLVEGMTGKIRTRLPGGEPGRASVIVAWCRRVGEHYHVGLRYFATC
ncbi:MAG: hypothetical protein CMJ36_04940 [Phycisphaerae bacterium]|nr:hypothetical protein [Phycisphaerae bacterium]